MRYFYSAQYQKSPSLNVETLSAFIDIDVLPKVLDDEKKIINYIMEVNNLMPSDKLTLVAFNPVWPSFDTEAE